MILSKSLRFKKQRKPKQQNFLMIPIQPPSSSPFYNAVSRVKNQFISSTQHETKTFGEVVWIETSQKHKEGVSCFPKAFLDERDLVI